MKRYRLGATCQLSLHRGDLTRWEGCAIVNAANRRMLGGGGVDGAIHRAAGPRLLEACQAVAEVQPSVRCPTGEARLTEGFDLVASYVIHTVGPVYRDEETSAPLLMAAHVNSLRLAARHGLKRIAFPAISCGVYGYPLDEAAEIAIVACREAHSSLEEVGFVLFGDPAFDAWQDAAEEALKPLAPA